MREDEEFVRVLRARTGPGPLEQYLTGEAPSDAISP